MCEVLSPVGDKSGFYTAIKSGCDAVYLGGKMFGARAFSNNSSNCFDLNISNNPIKTPRQFLFFTLNTLQFQARRR